MKKALAHIRSSDNAQQVLEEHLCNVAKLAGEFAAKAGLPLSGKIIGLLHDFGKYSNEFQVYLKSANSILDQDHDDYIDAKAAKGKIDHSSAGAQRVWKHYERKAINLPYAQFLAFAIASHHSGLIDSLSAEGEPVFCKRMGKEDAHTHLAACLQQSDEVIEFEIKQLLTPKIMEELHRCMLEIYKRATELLPPDASKADQDDNISSREVQRGLVARFLLSCLLDADRIDSAEFDDPKYRELRARMPWRPWERLIDRMEKHLSGFEAKCPVDNLRRDISNQCFIRAADHRGIFTLTVPTGGGKTLASLRFALHHAKKYDMDRVVYVIPYTSIIDQNAKVAREILEVEEEVGSIVLEHHSNILPDLESWQNKLLADNWEAPIVFTTMVQFLESLFGSGTRHARRMHNLANSIIIFDEIQTLPLRCMHLFCNALNFLLEVCGSSAVLCTATQPCLDKLPRPYQGQLVLQNEREIMPNVSGLFNDFKRVEFFDHCDKSMSVEEIAALALEELHRSGSCLVVCNTKDWAEQVYAQCLTQWSGALYYLSTHLCPAHRLEKLESLRKDLDPKTARPVLCVSTQLIECGVDVSFGTVIRFAAGLDSILQSAGRCNRHGAAPKGRVHIVTVQDENLEMLKDIRDGRSIYLAAIQHGCKAQLAATGYDLNQPDIIHTYFQHYFHRRKDVMAYDVTCADRDDTLLNMLGANTLVSLSEELPHQQMLRQSFATAASKFQVIDAPTQAVLVPYKQGEEIIAELYSTALRSRKRELLQAAQRYAVNLFPGPLKKLGQQRAINDIQHSGILAVNPAYYSDEFGVTTEPLGTLRPLVS